MKQPPRVLLFVVVGIAAACAAATSPSADDDERLLRENQIATDDAGLLHFFRERTLTPKQCAELKTLIERLGSPNFTTRTQAAADLVKAGSNAKPLLLDVIRTPSADLEVVRRAELCLREIGAGQEVMLAQAAARLLAGRRPKGTAAKLIAYVPFAGEKPILETVQQALNATAVRDGQADPALRKAITDPHPVRRAMAGEALVRAGGLTQKAAVAALLEDVVPQVRLQVALALVEARDKDAVATLIERLADSPAKDMWQIEDLLLRLADGVAPPTRGIRGNPAKLKEHWRQWWQEHADRVDLAKLDEPMPYLGYTLITTMSAKAAGSKLVELKPDRSVNFEIDNLSHPVDARVIAPGRVLIAEYMGRRVTERDFEGNILWEWAVALPIACQRLPGGDTFIATRRQLVIVSADRKEIFSYFHPQGSISAASWLRDGSMVLLDSAGQCRWLDDKGRETKSFPVGSVYTLGGNIDVLPNRHVVVPLYRDSRVAEFDTEGKEVWQARVPVPISATRLPNGHTLVVTMSPQRVVQFDAHGTQVWNHPLPGRGWRHHGADDRVDVAELDRLIR